MRHVLRWLAPLLICGASFVPALAQSSGRSVDPLDPMAKEVVHTPALEYTAAFLFVALVLVILCKPARKA